MPRTTATALIVPAPLVTTLTAITWTAIDAANGNQIRSTGKEQILFRNDDAGAVTVTVTSRALNGRTGDIAAVSVPAAAYRMTQIFPQAGWRQSDGMLYFSASDADMKFAVLRHR